MSYNFETTKQRSNIMKKIRSTNTAPEVLLRKELWGRGLRFSRKISDLPGKPDIVLKNSKIAIFIDGEFWHGYNWAKKKKTIRANRDYWIPKIERNILRDKKSSQELREKGWEVLRFWQKDVDGRMGACVSKIMRSIKRRG